jgi:hypothetical protein
VQALVAKCGTEIGPSRAFYSTRDHADDIDAVRRALGVDKIALEGTSYGTQLSVAYALTYPSHVERLILDSVADPAGRDPFALDDLQQMPKGLRSLCSGGLCRAATPNFVGELVKLANRMAAHPVTGKVAKPSGGTRTVRASGFDFLGGAVLDSDLNAGLAAELPAAVHAALRGQTRPLLRLVQLDRQTAITSAADLSMGLFTATVCDDGPFPWAPRRRSGSARACSRRPEAHCLGARPVRSAFGRPTSARPLSASSGRPRRAVRELARDRCRTCRCSSSRGSATSAHPARMRPRLPRASRRDGS